MIRLGANHMIDFLWCCLRIRKPPRCQERGDEFWMKFQELWVSSTLAAFVVALGANLPALLPKGYRVTLNAPDPICAFSYLYLVWLGWYFFVSWFNMEQD